jgi:hypothetical protein
MKFKDHKHLVTEAVAQALPSESFRRKRDSWCWAAPETKLLVYVESLPRVTQVHIDVAIWLEELAVEEPWALVHDSEFPSDVECPIHARTMGWTPAGSPDLARALDCSRDDLDSDWRKLIIREHIRNEVLPVLSRCTTLSGVAAVYRAGKFRHAFVHKRARELIDGLPST